MEMRKMEKLKLNKNLEEYYKDRDKRIKDKKYKVYKIF
jgi:hypothetical protein